MGIFKKKVDILDNPFLESKSEETVEDNSEEEIEEVKKVRNVCKVYFTNNQIITWTHLVENREEDSFTTLKNWFMSETSNSFLMSHANGYTCLNREAISYIVIEEENA